MSRHLRIPAGAGGEEPLQPSTLTNAVTKVVTLHPDYGHQLRLIVKWRFEDEEKVQQWYGTILDVTTDADTDETFLDVDFAHEIESRGQTYVITPLSPAHRLAFPYAHLGCSEYVEPQSTGDQHVVYYRAIVVIDDRADTGADEVEAYYFLQQDAFLEGKLGKVTLSDEFPSAPPTPSVSEVNGGEFGADEMASALRVVVNARFNDVNTQLKSLQATVRSLILKQGEQPNTHAVDELTRNVNDQLDGLADELEKSFGSVQTRCDDIERRLERLETKQRAEKKELVEELRSRIAKVQLQVARCGAATVRGPAPRVLDTSIPDASQGFDPFVAETFPEHRTWMNEMAYKILISGMNFHKKLGFEVRDELFKVWDQRETAILSVRATGGDPSPICDEYEGKLQRWATCLKAVVQEAQHNNNNTDQKLLYIIDITRRHTTDGPGDQDANTLVAEAEAQLVARGPKKDAKHKDAKPKKPETKKGDKAATDKGGSSGNGTGGR